jgi:hypothetical protein
MSLSEGRLPSIAAFITAAVLSAIGCGKSAGPVVKTEKVEGVVTLDGQPVPGATVTFVPVVGSSGASATGTTDSEGKYELTAVGAGSGAQPGAGTLPGEYNVGVRKVSVPEVQSEEQKAGLGSENAGPPSNGQRPQDAQLTHIVPQAYNDPQKSGLKFTVKEGENDIPIPLVSN